MDTYTDAICSSIALAPYEGKADTLYFGGGTPILLGEKRLAKILSAAVKHFGLEGAEITVEANPYSTLKHTLSSLYTSGVNRISFGLQSAVDSQLKLLSRNHTAKEAAQAVQDAQQVGYKNISLDLMLGVPDQTLADAVYSVQFCADLGVSHVSAYILKLEENTPFGKRYHEDDFDEELQAELYLTTASALEEQGFIQYEISNFSKQGAESKHNLKYWRCEEYLGLGPSAYSYMQGRRFSFPRDIQGFISAKNPFSITSDDGIGGDFEEYAMLRLRLKEGLHFAEIERLYGVSKETLLARGKRFPEGLLEIDEHHLALTREGFLLSNGIIGGLVF